MWKEKRKVKDKKAFKRKSWAKRAPGCIRLKRCQSLTPKPRYKKRDHTAAKNITGSSPQKRRKGRRGANRYDNSFRKENPSSKIGREANVTE